jgi:hypothetical protein
VLVGAAGLLAELLLLEHWELGWQLTPLVLLGAALLTGAASWRRPGPGTLKAFRAVMWLCVLAGVVGAVQHYLGNAEFEQESDPTLTGLALFWTAVRGATPGAGTRRDGPARRGGPALRMASPRARRPERPLRRLSMIRRLALVLPRRRPRRLRPGPARRAGHRHRSAPTRAR